MPKVNGLTRKQSIFVDKYISTWNATEAARQAGYKGTYNTLSVVGHENLQKPLVAEAIQKKIDKLSKRLQIEITKNLKKNGFVRRNRKPEMVYLFREEFGLHKIGKTSNLKSRLTTISTAYPYKIEVVMLIKGENAAKIEEELHNRFANKRVKGEWFDLTKDDVIWIQDNYEPNR